MDPLQILDSASILATLAFFALSAAYDLKTREVSDRVWLLYGPLGLALTAVRLYLIPSLLTLTLLSVGITTLASFGLLYFGLVGGADTKALICLGLTIPLVPSSYAPLVGYLHPFFPIVVIVISFFCLAAAVLWYGFKNLITFIRQGSRMFAGLSEEPWWRKLLASITGYPTSPARLKSTFYLYPMEEVVKVGNRPRRKFHLFFAAETDRDKAVSRFLKSLGKVGRPRKVWVSPGLPMLVFILIGLIITLIAGDLIFGTIFLFATR